MSGPARTLGGYVLGAKLGEGGMGAVFKATHPRFPGHAFAIKIMRGDGPPNPQAVERFQRETQALARAMAHPGIVRLLGVGVEREHPYYVMELAPGLSLDRLVEEEGPLEPQRAARLVREIAAAIAHAHGAGVIHRDLKPENVIVDTEAADKETARVCDFGLARLADSQRLTRSGAVLGTPAYSAPEQLAGQHAKAAPTLDVYSLGAVLFFVLTGDPPFEGESLVELFGKVQTAQASAPSTRRPGVPPALDAIVLKCLEKDPARRYATAKAFLEDLERFLSDRSVQAKAPARSRAPVLGALALVLVVLAIGAFAVLRGGEKKPRDGSPPGPEDAARSAERHAAAERALAVLAKKESRPADLVAATEQLAASSGSLPAVFADDERSSAGDLVLGRALALRADGRPEAAAVLSAGAALAEARLRASPGDAGALALRALAALAGSGAPVEPLGTGRIAGVAPGLVSDLDRAAAAPGRVGRRTAWLAVDARLWQGDEAGARDALFRASTAAPDPALEKTFRWLLDAPANADGFARLTKDAQDPVRAAVLAQRFLARCGAPGALDDAAFAKGASDAALVAFLNAEAPLAFALHRAPPDFHAQVHEFADLVYEMRGSDTSNDEAKLAERLASYGPRVLAAAEAIYARYPDPTLLLLCNQIPQLGATAVIGEAIVVRHHASATIWLAGAFDRGARELSKTGIEVELFPPELELDVAGFDRAVELALPSSPILPIVGHERLALGATSAKALKRLEALTADAARGERLVFDMLVGLEAFARLSGPAVLPFRARARRLAFPGPLGEALARLDALRAERAIVETGKAPWASDTDMSEFAWLCAGAAAESSSGRDLGRELYELGVAWARETEIFQCRGRPAELNIERRLQNCRLQNYFRPVERYVDEREFVVTPEDRARAASSVPEFRPPRFVPERKR